MEGRTVGFVGGGRVAQIILGGFSNSGKMPAKVVVSDVNSDVLKRLQSVFPDIQTALNNNGEAAAQE